MPYFFLVRQLFALIDWHFYQSFIFLTLFFNISESDTLSDHDQPVRIQGKSVTLVEDEVSFSLSFDDEDFDAEVTDERYEKVKNGKKSKINFSKKSSKPKKSDLPDNESGESAEEEVGEELEKEENITPTVMTNIKTNMESPTFRSKSTVYNTSQLTGWYSFFHYNTC